MRRALRIACVLLTTGLLGAVTLSACFDPPSPFGGGDGEGEGPGPCTAQPSAAWDGETVDYSQCSYPERYTSTCVDDSCVDGPEEAELVAVFREIAAERGYGERLEITDVEFELLPEDFGTWHVSWLVRVDWFRCVGEDGGESDGTGLPSREVLEDVMPKTGEVVETIPSAAELADKMRSCAPDAPDVYFRPCLGDCRRVEGVIPGDGEGCDQVNLSLIDPNGDLLCPGEPDRPPPGCEIPDDWACPWREYTSPRCTCLPGEGSSCPYFVAPTCWTCAPERFGDFVCDTDCGAEDPECTEPVYPGAEGEGEGEFEPKACEPSPYEFLCE